MSAASTFGAGDTVFDILGREAVYVARGVSGHIVMPMYEVDDEDYPETIQGDATTWGQVFRTPPTEVLDERIKQLGSDEREIQQRVDAAREELTAAQHDLAKVRQVYKDHPGLENLDNWLAGKVTHIVALNYYGVEIGTIEEVLLRHEDRRNVLRLCSVYIDARAERAFTAFAAYSDGSGGQTRCILATSLEDARDQALKHLRVEMSRNAGNTNILNSLLLSYQKAGVSIPAEYRAKLAEAEATARANLCESARRSVNSAREALARAEAELQRAEGGTA